LYQKIQKTIVRNKENLLKKKFNLDIALVLLLLTVYSINTKKKAIFKIVKHKETLIKFKTPIYISRKLINIDNIENLEFKYILLT